MGRPALRQRRVFVLKREKAQRTRHNGQVLCSCVVVSSSATALRTRSPSQSLLTPTTDHGSRDAPFALTIQTSIIAWSKSDTNLVVLVMLTTMLNLILWLIPCGCAGLLSALRHALTLRFMCPASNFATVYRFDTYIVQLQRHATTRSLF